MAIPEDIRKVERPVNTIVRENKTGGIYRYMVIERIGCKRVNGKNVPINGKTIGHIIDGKYIEGRRKLTNRMISYRDWGEYALAIKVSENIFNELLKVYDYKDAQKILSIAIIRVLRPNAPDYMLLHHYNSSWLSEEYPSIAIDKNSVSRLISLLGKDHAGIVSFMRKRVEDFSLNHHLCIDGTVKNYTSSSTMSKASRKSRERGCLNISVLYAFDINTGEPICSKAYPGNVIDSVAYESFITENDLKSGLIIADKGFPYSKAKEAFKDREELHYLNPLKRTDKLISELNLYSYTGCLDDKNLDVRFSKAQKGNKWYYGFYNRSLAAKEEYDYFKHHKSDKEYDKAKWDDRSIKFGTIAFESDRDLDPSIVYKTYEERWAVEECFRTYKQILEFNDTRVHSDVSVHGTEFINFISTCIATSIRNLFKDKGIFNSYTYTEAMEMISSAKKVKVSQDDVWTLVTIPGKAIKVLETVGLIEATDEELANSNNNKKKKGTPKASKIKSK